MPQALEVSNRPATIRCSWQAKCPTADPSGDFQVKNGIQFFYEFLDPGFRRGDGLSEFCEKLVEQVFFEVVTLWFRHLPVMRHRPTVAGGASRSGPFLIQERAKTFPTNLQNHHLR